MPTKPTGPAGAVRATAAPARDAPRPDGRPAALSEGDDAFELWLRHALRRSFDSVAAEPVPEDLLRLIEEDRAERERIRRSRAREPGA